MLCKARLMRVAHCCNRGHIEIAGDARWRALRLHSPWGEVRTPRHFLLTSLRIEPLRVTFVDRMV